MSTICSRPVHKVQALCQSLVLAAGRRVASSEADAVRKLSALRATGVRTIVDPTVLGLGRYIPRIQRVNQSVDLNIIVATGVYAFLEWPSFLDYRSVDAIAELFVREIREGIDDTGVKAGFLKCAVERHGLIGDAPRILSAIAAASVETGAPVMVHANAAEKTGLPALEALTAQGVDPARIVIAHAGENLLPPLKQHLNGRINLCNCSQSSEVWQQRGNELFKGGRTSSTRAW